MTAKKDTAAEKKKAAAKKSSKLENKAAPAPKDDARIDTAAYPQGTAPPTG
jgi:hypothetical protein